MPRVTIDLSKVSNVANFPEGLSEAQKTYIDLDYLNTNSRIDPLAKLRSKLATNPTKFSDKEKEFYQEEFFGVLEKFAQRIDDPKIQEVYQEYLNAEQKEIDVEEKKKQFIRACSSMSTDGGIDWHHNQVEVVVAKTLEVMMDKDSKGQDIADRMESAMQQYTKACIDQASKDFHRNEVCFEDDTRSTKINEQAKFDKKEYGLTGEQHEFINTVYEQGKFAGGTTVGMMGNMQSNGVMPGATAVPEVPKTYLYKKDNRTYLMRSDKLVTHDIEDPSKTEDFARVHTIIDITDLKGDGFSPGCGSKQPEVRMVVEGSSKNLDILDIPSSITSANNELDESIILAAKTSEERGKIRGVAQADPICCDSEESKQAIADIVYKKLYATVGKAEKGGVEAREEGQQLVEAMLEPLQEKFSKEDIKSFSKKVVDDFAYEHDQMDWKQKFVHHFKKVFTREKYQHKEMGKLASGIKASLKRHNENKPLEHAPKYKAHDGEEIN